MTLDFNCKNNTNLNMCGSNINVFVKYNLEDGQGPYSLVQKQGIGGSHGSDPNEFKPASIALGKNAVAFGVQGESIGDCSITGGYGAKALEKSCVAFGNGVAGRTSDEWIQYYWDSTKGEAINNGGGLLDVPSDIIDYTNKGIIFVNGIAKYVLGPSKTKYGGFLFNPSFTAGQATKAKGFCSFSFGYKAYAMADHTFVTGNETQSLAPYGYAGGYYTINNSKGGIVYGYYLNSSLGTIGQAIFGKYNIENMNVLLQVGNGTKDAQRSNAFEVLADGRAKVYGAPIDDNDVIRKCDITTSINQEFFNLLYA